jgi:hypothetical protein
MFGEIFADKYKIVEGQDQPETQLSAGNYPASGSYVDVSEVERFHVVIHLGTIHASDTPVFEVKEADANDGTLDVISATYAKHTCAANDDGEWIVFTIETDKLSADHHFVSTVVSGVTNGSYADIFYLLPGLSQPVTQTAGVLPSASQYQYVG